MDLRSLEATLAQVQGLRSDLGATKRKALLELFVSSFATILLVLPLLWLLLQTSIQFKSGIFGFSPTVLAIPLLLNAAMWAVWVASAVLQSTGPHQLEGRFREDDDVRSLYMEYEWLRHSLFRAQRVEQMLDLLTALTFVTIALTLAFLITSVARLV